MLTRTILSAQGLDLPVGNVGYFTTPALSEMSEMSDTIRENVADRRVMNIREILKFADELVFAKTGEHLDYLEEAILRGTLQGETYSQIAAENHTSEGHLRDVGSELWKTLSDVFGEQISKANFRAKVEKSLLCNVTFPFGKTIQRIGKVNICPEIAQSSTPTQQPQETSTQPHIDLGDAPEILSFSGRTDELATLENWILQERCRIIALLGINGIGKTTLSLRLIEQIKTHFDYVIYRSLRFSPSLNATLNNLRMKANLLLYHKFSRQSSYRLLIY